MNSEEDEFQRIEAEAKRRTAQQALPDERNFCPRCGKRTADLTTIHTCTPPQRGWQELTDNGKRGSIALARSLCYQINGAADDSDDMDGGGYGSVDIAEILSAEVVRLQKALAQPEAEPVAWAVQACSKMWRGEFAEIDAKAEAKRIGGTCVAYPLYTAQREWAGLTDKDWEKVENRKNTVLDTFEQGAVWAAYKLERRNT